MSRNKATAKQVNAAMKAMKCNGPYFIAYSNRRDKKQCLTHGRKWSKRGCKFASRVADAVVAVDTAPVT